MWIPFLLENIHFAVHLFAALVFFAVFWLYFDAWRERKETKVTIKIIGFFLLSVSLIIEATVIETSILSAPIFWGVSPEIIAASVRILAYGSIIAGLLLDPLQDVPNAQAQVGVASGVNAVSQAAGPIGASIQVVSVDYQVLHAKT